MMRRSSSANEEIISRATYLLSGATSADAFLQAYRAFHMLVQLVFLAIGVGLIAGVFLFDDPVKAGFVTAMVFGFAWASSEVARQITRMIEGRRADVAFWYTKLIMIENELPDAQRYFTALRIARKTREPYAESATELSDIFLQAQQISEREVERLMSAGTFSAIETRLLSFTRLAWLAFGLIGVLYTLYEFLDWLF